jgi:ribosomal protein S26
MMLPRLIIALIIVVAVIVFMRHLRTRLGTPRSPALEAKTVRCEKCQVYLPRAEAVVRGAKHYCSVEHADMSGD